MKMNTTIYKMTGALGLLMYAGLASANAEAWSFGVMADTQATLSGTAYGTNSVATTIISAVNQQFNASGVKFVIQVGDLTDNGSTAGLQTRLDANSGSLTGVTGLNVPFYALRGNHEDTATDATYFQNSYIPSSTSNTKVEVAPDGLSYAVTYNNTKLVLLDINTAYSTTTLDQQTSWMSNGSNNGVLQESDHSQAFVFEHKNLLGQNHKDNEFGSGNDANTTQQNAFFSALSSNGVRYDISGHDHMNHRSVVTSPDGQSKVQEIICQSDSTKWYAASTGFSSREQTISDEQNKIGYYTFTIDGPCVTGRYYATSIVNNNVGSNPTWSLQDSFGYSTNGKEFTIARGLSLTGIQDSVTAGSGFVGTNMAILAGVNTVTGTAEGSRAEVSDVNTGWTAGGDGLASDVLHLWGLNDGLGSAQADMFTLSMSYDADLVASGVAPSLDVLDGSGNWVPAVQQNYGGSGHWVGNSAPTSALGDYGYDATTGTVWANINYDNASEFAAVPEPNTFGLLGLGSLGLAAFRRRNRR